MSDFYNEPIKRTLPSVSDPNSGSSMAMTPEQLQEWKTKMGYGGRHSRRHSRRRHSRRHSRMRSRGKRTYRKRNMRH